MSTTYTIRVKGSTHAWVTFLDLARVVAQFEANLYQHPVEVFKQDKLVLFVYPEGMQCFPRSDGSQNGKG